MKKRYDWSQWFRGVPGADGKVRFVLVRGRHYDCSQSSMVSQLRVAATHCGVRVAVVDLEDRLSVVVVPKVAEVVDAKSSV